MRCANYETKIVKVYCCLPHGLFPGVVFGGKQSSAAEALVRSHCRNLDFIIKIWKNAADSRRSPAVTTNFAVRGRNVSKICRTRPPDDPSYFNKFLNLKKNTHIQYF